MILLLLIILGVLVVFVGIVLYLMHGNDRMDEDAATWLGTAAANRLPKARQEWANAMRAELAYVPTGPERWRFAVGMAGIALGRSRAVLITGAIGLAISAGATLVVRTAVQPLQVVVAVAGVLLSVYAARRAAIRPGPRTNWVVAGALLTSTAAVLAIVIDTVMRYPAAAPDPTHLFSIIFAVTLTAYIALALTPPTGLMDDKRAARWGITGGLAGAAVWATLTLIQPTNIEGTVTALWPAAVVPMVVAFGVAMARRSGRAGAQAGVWAGLIGGELLFVVNLIPFLALHNVVLTDPYDIKAFPHSGFPNPAAYILNDDLGGLILSLIWLPMFMAGLSIIGATIGTTARKAMKATTP